MRGVYLFQERRVPAAARCGGRAGKMKGEQMKLKQIMLIALVAGLPACGILAQDQNGGPQNGPKGPPPGGNGDHQGGPNGGPGSKGRGRRPPPPIIAALDANHDGVLSAEEIANAPAALKALDKNSDGQLTEDELRPQGPPPGGPDGQQGERPPQGLPPGGDANHPHPPMPPVMMALDTNGDGVLSADEIANASASLLKLDKNGDGQLTMDEIRPPRGKPPGGGDK
jgi:hypothetical protein